MAKESTAALFGGQGFFQPGMGEVAFRKYAAAREVFAESTEAAGFDLTRVCFGDKTHFQDDPRIVQPAIVTVGLAEYYAWLEQHEKPNVVTGMSLGLYPAMRAAEIFISNGDVIKAVSERAKMLYEVHRRDPGGMAGFVGVKMPDLNRILEATGVKLAIMRDRKRGSVVVAGTPDQLKHTETEARKNGVRKFEFLNIFGRFHHADNAEVQQPYLEYLHSVELREPTIRIVGNHAILLDTAEAAIGHAVDQLVEHVDWDAVIEELSRQGVKYVLEIGPDKSRGLARQMDKRFNTQIIKFPEEA